MHRSVLLSMLTVLLTLPACRESAEPVGSVQTTPAWLLTQAPTDARTVGEIKPLAVEGDRVVMRGRIGGRKDPITPGVGVFMVVDPGVPSCDQIPGDNCPSPWDYCCEPRDSLTANSATIQLVDDAGKPIESDLSGAGLRPLDEVVIIGTVGPRPSAQILTIRATGLYRVGG